MELQPTLSGLLVQLRPLAATDFDSLFEAASDPKIWEQHPQPNFYQRREFEQYFKWGIESKGALLILDAQTSRVIGSSRFYEYNSEKQQVIIGYTFLTRSYWGGTFNREVKSLMLKHAFCSVDTVIFHVGEKNFRSRRALAKIGAVFSHKISKDLPDGVTQERDVFLLTKKDFEAL